MTDGSSLTIGIDIGGTKLAAGLVDGTGNIILKTRMPMLVNESENAGLDCVVRAIKDVLLVVSKASESIRGIGICAPGPLDPRTGTILNPPHVPCWRNYPLAERVEALFGVGVRVDNDANAAGLAESIWGAGKSYSNVFYATLGTGVGTGIIFDRAIYYGRTGSAGEGGHTTIDYKGPKCSCGKRGCADVLCSGPAIAERARTKVIEQGSARILELAGSVDQISSEHVGQAFAEGDPVASEVLRETADLVTIWLGNMVDLLDPDVMVIGGGVGDLLRPLFDYIRAGLPDWSVNPRVAEIALVGAHYGADAGIAGAAALLAETG